MKKIQIVLGLLALLVHLVTRGGIAVILLGVIIGALLVPLLVPTEAA